MVRSIGQIEQELVTLEESLEAIAQDFETVYREYLQDLGQIVSQQLILAAYHLCTQGYPERFLQLSMTQRQELQQSLRKLASRSQSALLAYLETPDTDDPAASSAEDEIALSGALASLAGFDADSDTDAPSASTDRSPDAAPPETGSADATQASSPANLAADLTLNVTDSDASHPPASDRTSESPFEPDPLSEEEDEASESQASPAEANFLEQVAKALLGSASSSPADSTDPLERLLRWQERVEQGINEVLSDLSAAANQLLHQANVLPRSLPEPVLEVATKAGVAAEATTGAPNLMNLVIEAKTEDSEESGIIRIMAIRMRLSEVEFANPTLSGWRTKLRTLSHRLNKVAQEYRKKQKERAIAQAEHAWRSSWFED